MPDTLAGVLATPGLAWLALAFAAAGVVRGFTGFGTALIVMPVAAGVLPMPVAVAVMTVSGMLTWPLIVPGAVRAADRREVLLLAGAAMATAPVGVWLLGRVAQDALRWAVAIAAAATLLALMTGWRYRGRVRGAGLAAVGAAAGLLGGATGLTGPPAVLFYLAGTRPGAVVRANTILFLALLDIGIAANLGLRGMFGREAVALAAVLALPYGLGIAAGQALFCPGRERLYRVLACWVIGAAILSGLPLFG